MNSIHGTQHWLRRLRLAALAMCFLVALMVSPVPAQAARIHQQTGKGGQSK